MEGDNDAYNINQCVNVCPDKYLKYNDNFCRRCILKDFIQSY